MGFIYNLPFLVLVSVGAAICLAPRRPGRRRGVAAELVRAAEPVTRPLFAFFGLPPAPPLPVVGVAAAVAGASGLVLGALGCLAFGSASPLLALNTLATALALGLLAAKLYVDRGRKPPGFKTDREAA